MTEISALFLLQNPKNVYTVNILVIVIFLTNLVDLQPFTDYSLTLQVCNNAGCVNSTQTAVSTLQATPEEVSTPVPSSITSDSLQLSWLTPAQPNGVILGYEVFRRESPFTGQGVSIENLSANELSVSITELNAFTEYEFAVSAATVAGATLSEFVRITTLEAGEFMRTSAPCNGTSLHHKII